MRPVVAIGEGARVRAFALAGVGVTVADDAADVRAAWTSLGREVGLVILTAPAAVALAAELADPGERLWLVLPE